MPQPDDGGRPAALAHEMRTALTVASMGVQLALRRVVADGGDRGRLAADLRGALAAIQEASGRVDGLIAGPRPAPRERA